MSTPPPQDSPPGPFAEPGGAAAMPDYRALAMAVSEVAPCILYVYDLAAQRNVWGNQAMEQALGYSVADLARIERPLIPALIHPDDLAPYQAHCAALLRLADGERLTFEYRMKRRDGRWIWLSSHDMVFRRDAAGQPLQIVGSAIDVTDQRAAQQSMAELEQVYARAPLGLALLDADLRFVRVNQALAEINGVPAADHIGRRPWELSPDLRDSAEPALREVLETGAVLRDVPVTGTTAARPGEVREWREQFYPVHDTGGAIIGVGAVCEEVTERLRMERELRASEQHLRRVIDRLFAFVGTLTPDGVLVEANRAPIEAAGIAYEEVVGRPFADTYWWAYDRAVQDQLRAAIDRANAGETVRYDVPVRMRGALMTIDFQIAPLADAELGITHLVVSGVPIDDRLAAQAELRLLNESLERRVEEEVARRESAQAALFQSQKLDALGRLTAGITHDFNNILAALNSGFALVERWSQDERVRAVAREGTASAQRGAELVRHLLAFSRKQALAPQVIRPAELLAGAQSLLRQSAGPGVTLEIDCPADTPAIRADRVQLEAALLNLVVNARDAMDGRGRITIRTTAEPASAAEGTGAPGAEGMVVFAVRDEGTGMAPDLLERVREPFFTTKPPGSGTGLGLAMVHGFLEQSGGHMEICSRVGEGTTVRIALPAAPAAAPA